MRKKTSDREGKFLFYLIPFHFIPPPPPASFTISLKYLVVRIWQHCLFTEMWNGSTIEFLCSRNSRQSAPDFLFLTYVLNICWTRHTFCSFINKASFFRRIQCLVQCPYNQIFFLDPCLTLESTFFIYNPLYTQPRLEFVKWKWRESSMSSGEVRHAVY